MARFVVLVCLSFWSSKIQWDSITQRKNYCSRALYPLNGKILRESRTNEYEWNTKLKCLFDAMVEVYDEWPDGRAAVELTTQRYLGEREEEQG